MPRMTVSQQEQAYAILQKDAEKIVRLIEVQLKNLTMPQCPLYEEVLDTHMFGLSREIDFAVRLNLISKGEGNILMEDLERKLNEMHETVQNSM